MSDVQKISLNDPAPPAAPPIQPVNPDPQPITPPEPPAPQDPPADPPADPQDPQDPPVDPVEEPQDPPTDDEIQAQLEFFEEVNRMRGITDLQVDYGDVSPNSVEGMAIRERALEEYTIQKFQENLAKQDPRGAAYLLHRAQGGTDEEFFARKTLVLPDYDVFKENVALQKQVYKSNLMKKGLSSEKADALVKISEDNNTLLQEADEAYQEQQQADQQELARLAQLAQQERDNWSRQVRELDTVLNDSIKSPNLKVVIPDKEQEEFNQFVRGFVQHDGEHFYIAQQIDPKTVPQIIESLYLQFKKGDLSAIITRKANTLNVKRNQIALGGSRKAVTSPPPAPPASKRTTLSDIKFPGQL